jgi:hypothetical protein
MAATGKLLGGIEFLLPMALGSGAFAVATIKRMSFRGRVLSKIGAAEQVGL